MTANRFLVAILLLLFISPLLFNNSCKHDPMGIEQLDTVCFETQILPALQTSCGISGCHDAFTGEGGFSATDYNSIMQIVNPGNAAKSKLYQVITDIKSDEMMPPNRPLSKELRTLILVWIEQGANNTACINGGGGGGNQQNMDTICFSQNIAPIIQSSCGKTSCHDIITHEGDYILTNFNTLMQNSEGIIPFNPNGSKIYKVITTTDAGDIMPPPPNPPLTIEQKEQIRKWISQGALNSNCPWTTCDTTGVITFSLHLQPIIQNSCLGCHNPSNANGSVDLSNYTQVKYYSETLRNGIPIIMGALNHTVGFKPMPPSGILSTCQIRTFELWISQGMLNN